VCSEEGLEALSSDGAQDLIHLTTTLEKDEVWNAHDAKSGLRRSVLIGV
jgi:hypothetical protein